MQEMNKCKMILSTIFLLFASIQWFIIGERTKHAFFQWNHFVDFNGGGHTTMNLETVITGYIGSCILILFGFAAQKYIKATRVQSIIIKTSTYMLIFGLAWLSMLILSPFSKILGA
jgi:hypothetical protein